MTVWDIISPFFHKKENWGDPSKMSGLLLVALNALREDIGMPIIIHYGYATKGHVKNSRHYKGDAVDFHFDTPLPYKEQIDLLQASLDRLQLSDFVGLGIYPDWAIPGFHLDTRGEKARWGAKNEDVDGSIKQKYIAFDAAYDIA